jgi:hypothetical protein
VAAAAVLDGVAQTARLDQVAGEALAQVPFMLFAIRRSFLRRRL